MMNMFNQNKFFFLNYFDNKRLFRNCTKVLQFVRIESRYFGKREDDSTFDNLGI